MSRARSQLQVRASSLKAPLPEDGSARLIHSSDERKGAGPLPIGGSLVCLTSDHRLVAACGHGEKTFTISSKSKSFDVVLKGDPSHSVSAMAWMPLKSLHKHRTTWALLVGSTDGVIRCYDQQGELLMSQVLHKAPIDRIKVCCGVSHLTRSRRDILVLYANVLCFIDGDSVRHSISEAATNLKATGDSSHSPRSGGGNGDSSSSHRMTWVYNKWHFYRNSQVTDAILCGQMEPADLDEEFSTALGISAAVNPHFLVVGAHPMLSYCSPDKVRVFNCCPLFVC